MSSKVGFRLDETILLFLFEKKSLREYPKALKLVFTPRPLFFEKKKPLRADHKAQKLVSLVVWVMKFLTISSKMNLWLEFGTSNGVRQMETFVAKIPDPPYGRSISHLKFRF